MLLVPSLIRTLPDLKAAVAACGEYEAFAIDVETDGLDVRKNNVTWVGLSTYGQVHLIPILQTKGRKLRPEYRVKGLPPVEERATLKNGGLSQRKIWIQREALFGDPGVQLQPAEVFRELKPLLFSGAIKVGHNLKFDLMSIGKYYGELPPGPYEDTLVMTHVTDENRRTYELKEIMLDLFHVRQLEARRAFYPKLGKNISAHAMEDVARYLAQDVYYTWLLWKFQRGRIDRQKLLSVLKLEMDLYPVIMAMENNGAAIDTDRLAVLGQQLGDEIEHIENQCWTLTGDVFDLTNVTRKRELLFAPKIEGGQGLKPFKVTPKQGHPVLDAAVLEHYRDKNPLADLFLKWSEAAKIHSTYILGIEKRLHKTDDGQYVHTSFAQHRTVTGRLSSNDPNVQNIPRESDIRGLFIAPPGWRLVVADYDQIELRVTAHFCKDPVMLGIFEAGLDIHAGTAAQVLGKDIHAVTKEERQIGKGLNFAVVYGAGPQRVAAMARVSEAKAKIFLERYYDRFGSIQPWKRSVLLEAHRRGNRNDVRNAPPYVTTLLGRKRRLPDLYSDERLDRGRAERQAINHKVQGTAAEIMKIAMIRIHKAYEGTPFKMLMTVHDEMVSCVPEGMEEEAQATVVTAMSGITYNKKPIIDVPLVVSCGVAQRWSDAH